MKKFLLSFSFATTILIVLAQQDPQFTQWQFERQSFNPAVVGTEKMHCVSVFHRDQWDGLDHDPKTYLVNYQGAFGPKQLDGGGITFFTEVLGQQQNTILRGAYARHFALNNGSFFSAGNSLGMIQIKLGANWVFIDAGDPTIPTSSTSEGVVDINLGITLYKPKKYYFGLSSTHLNAADMKNLNIKVARHYYAMGGLELPMGADLTLRPNLLVKSDFAATQIDVNADVLWNQMLWGGISYRPGDAVSPYVGFMTMFDPIKSATMLTNHGLKLGYSYDVTTSDIKDYSAGSHEIFLTYCMSFSEIPIRARHSNPRFL